MTEPLLQVSDLRTWFGEGDGAAHAVDGVDFVINRGETFALLGESGCGKSMTALSILQLIPKPAARIVSGRILLEGDDLLVRSEAAMREVRGSRIAMIFQEPQSSLNPVLSVGSQIGETVRRHTNLRNEAVRSRVIELLDAVGIPDPDRRHGEYPHQLSGGMKQRVMIAMALAAEPDLLIADEPTTALDVTIQAQVLDLLRGLQQKTGMALLLITHDLGVVSSMADRVGVMYAGQIVETSDAKSFFANPQHPYSQKLFASLPDMHQRGEKLSVIRGSVPLLTQKFSGCRFADRCDYVQGICRNTVPRVVELAGGRNVRCHLHDPDSGMQREVTVTDEPVRETLDELIKPSDATLKVENLKVHFPIYRGIFRRVTGYVYAVDGVDLEIPPGRTVALVGESGCGKTTAGKGILQLIKPSGGRVIFDGVDLTGLSDAELRARRSDIQIIFQDPYASMNPRMLVGDIIAEGMVAQGIGKDRAERMDRVEHLLAQVGLPAEARQRYPHEFSGGQRQRICIARALAVNPKLIVCDEPTSALDVSVQAQILNLLRELQDQYGLSYLFITHNLSVVDYLAHEVAVMYLGRIVETGTVEEVLHSPKHPYTKALLSAVPVIDPDKQRSIIRLAGELPSPANPPAGCHFHPRCPEAQEICRQRYPDAVAVSETHTARCVLLE